VLYPGTPEVQLDDELLQMMEEGYPLSARAWNKYARLSPVPPNLTPGRAERAKKSGITAEMVGQDRVTYDKKSGTWQFIRESATKFGATPEERKQGRKHHGPVIKGMQIFSPDGRGRYKLDVQLWSRTNRAPIKAGATLNCTVDYAIDPWKVAQDGEVFWLDTPVTGNKAVDRRNEQIALRKRGTRFTCYRSGFAAGIRSRTKG